MASDFRDQLLNDLTISRASASMLAGTLMIRAQAVAATSPMPLIFTEPKPFDVYEVIDAEIEGRRSSSRARSWIQRRSYFDREFATALILFEQAAAADPEDVVPTFFAERSARYLKAPPPADWQGFEKLTSK